MLSIQPTSPTTAYSPPQSTQPEQDTAKPATKTPQVPSVEVSSSAALLFNALADLILGGAATDSQDGSSASTPPQANADGDENANGMEVNDGDADDMPMGAMPQFSDAGTYSFGGATA